MIEMMCLCIKLLIIIAIVGVILCYGIKTFKKVITEWKK